jgi:hypothetical protein
MSSAKREEAVPRLSEKPSKKSPLLLRNSPPQADKPGEPRANPSMLHLIQDLKGAAKELQ